jgi:ectoine hydroxylase-related dioxygenase (phytanoyl-CoA dioxygenase family)
MKEPKDILVSKEGYILFSKFIPSILITDFVKLLPELKLVRATNKQRQYAEKDKITELSSVDVWWSQEVDSYKETLAIRRIVDPLVLQNFPTFKHYVSDVVTINPNTDYMNPHVDTPHRFAKWNYDKRFLGIQCVVSLDYMDKTNASTGLVPFSQKRDFDIAKCYKGEYDNWFKSNCQQLEMSKGSLLMYNCRVLHSSMPNMTDKPRPALLINYLEKSIMDEVKTLDNVWSSNGKSP